MRSIFMSLALINVFALAACGGGSSGGGSGTTTNPVPVVPTTAPVPVPTTAASDPTLPQATTVNGQNVWETKGGLVLYEFNGDSAGVSNCTGSCAVIWPPLMSGTTSKAVGSFTMITRSNPSGTQWAYQGKPLYTFSSDKPGQPPTGNNFQGFTFALVAGQSGGPSPPPGCQGPYC